MFGGFLKHKVTQIGLMGNFLYFFIEKNKKNSSSLLSAHPHLWLLLHIYQTQSKQNDSRFDFMHGGGREREIERQIHRREKEHKNRSRKSICPFSNHHWQRIHKPLNVSIHAGTPKQKGLKEKLKDSVVKPAVAESKKAKLVELRAGADPGLKYRGGKNQSDAGEIFFAEVYAFHACACPLLVFFCLFSLLRLLHALPPSLKTEELQSAN